MAYSIVMVLKRFTHQAGVDNLKRFIEIGLPTYRKWLDVAAVQDFFVIGTKPELGGIQKDLTAAAPEFPWRFVYERDLVAAGVPNGWAVQQIAKVAVARLVKTETYLIVDDDTYLTRPFGEANLKENGKYIMNRVDIDFPMFHLWSAQALGANYDTIQYYSPWMGITPQIFVKEVVLEIMERLQKRHGAEWQQWLADHKFTEYCMYWTHLIDTKKAEAWYATGEGAPSVYGSAATGPEHDVAERIKGAFEGKGFYFSFVQTSLPNATIEFVKNEIAKYV